MANSDSSVLVTSYSSISGSTGLIFNEEVLVSMQGLGACSFRTP
jgi:hypothetical protein